MYLAQILKALKNKKAKEKLHFPALWIDSKSSSPIFMDYATFLSINITKILDTKISHPAKSKSWIDNAVIYNLFVRLCTAYDHDQDGEIGQKTGDITLNQYGIRETGTFLKTIAILPYLKKLGINTIHLLPITEIGVVGRKGDMGSPYAIKNPFKIDPNLADPIVDIPVEDQYKALIEAAHRLGIRVVQEFIFRTTAIDADWTTEHPDWFYWIDKNNQYGQPKFSKSDLEEIEKVPEGKGKYIAPNKSYRSLFKLPPKPGYFKNLKTASAFADWPPNDVQPPWSDVTYLRMYQYDFTKENNYNYIAYNTIRYYDPELARPENENTPLWNDIAGIIPYFQKNFGIDGAMIDMGHALPENLKSNIIAKAREVDPSFAFLDENFDNKDSTKKEGYNAVIGNAWYIINKRNGFRRLILSALDETPLPYFGTAETHNSPRYQNKSQKKAAWILFSLLPNSIPFLHNGYELNEQLPVNTGLNFTAKEIKELSSEPLALFNKTSLDWDTSENSVGFMMKIEQIKVKYPWIFDGYGMSILNTSNKKVLGFMIETQDQNAVILFNVNFYRKEQFTTRLTSDYLDLLQDKKPLKVHENILLPGKVIIAISPNE